MRQQYMASLVTIVGSVPNVLDEPEKFPMAQVDVAFEPDELNDWDE